VFFVIIALLAWKGVPFVMSKLGRIKITQPAMSIALALCFLFAYIAEYFGIAGIIGAFAAGIAISQTEFKEEIEKKVSSKSKTPTQGITIKGIDNIKVRFSKCCNPVPGDDIVGYITRGRGVSVHRSDCPNINDLSKEARFIEVEWDTRKKVSYQAEIQIKAVDRAGLLSQITQLLSEVNLVLASLNARTNKEKLALINMTLEIKNIDQLNDLMKKIRSLKGVMDVYRVST